MHRFAMASPGSSSTNIKDILEHTYAQPILEIDLSTNPEELLKDLDVLYLYEDGLWSGVELVRRLNLISQWPRVRNRDMRIVFKICRDNRCRTACRTALPKARAFNVGAACSGGYPLFAIASRCHESIR